MLSGSGEIAGLSGTMASRVRKKNFLFIAALSSSGGTTLAYE